MSTYNQTGKQGNYIPDLDLSLMIMKPMQELGIEDTFSCSSPKFQAQEHAIP